MGKGEKEDVLKTEGRRKKEEVESGVVVPDGWKLVSLGECVAPRKIKALPADCKSLPYIGLEHVEAHSMKILGHDSAANVVSSGFLFEANDVLYSRLRPYLNKVAQPNFHGLCSSEFIVFPPYDQVVPEFLRYRLNSLDFVRFANSLNAGDRPRVDFGQISSFKFLLPSSFLQRKIVAKIEELFSDLDAGVESLKKAQAQLKVYRQSVLKAAFEGKLTASDQEWSKTLLSKHIDFLTSGSRGWADYYSNSGSTFIRAQNIKHDYLELEDIAYVSLPKNAEGKRTKIELNDLLITITGANVAKSALVKTPLEDAYVSQHVALCRFKESISPPYAYWFIVSEAWGRKQLNEAAYGAGKPGLNLQNIKEISIRYPSIIEQNAIVNRIEELLSIEESFKALLEASLNKATTLRQSILKRAFEGKLV